MAAAKQPDPPPARRYGLLHVIAIIAVMTALGAALGVLAAHLGH